MHAVMRNLPAMILVACPTIAAAAVTAIVWQGQPAGSNSTFDTLNRPRITPDGDVVFSAFLAGDGIGSANDLTMWAGGVQPQLICQEGYAFPAAGSGVTGICPVSGAVTSGRPAAHQLRVFGWDWLSGDGVNTGNDTVRTMFLNVASSSLVVTREGEPAPETGGLFGHASTVDRVASTGLVAFLGPLTGSTMTSAVWAGQASVPSLLAGVGDAAQGLGENFQGFSSLVLSSWGNVAFRGWTATGAGLYRAFATGSPSLVAGTGTIMPGAGALQDVGGFTINRRGVIAIQGQLQSGQTGIWAADGATLRAVALPGQAAPDSGSFAGFGEPSVNDGGDICFFAQMVSGADGLYCEIDRILQVIVREDDSPTALEPGEIVGDLLWLPVINSSHQVLFLSQVNSNPGFHVTWWLRTTAGTLEIVARAGANLEVLPGTFKTINTLDVPTGDFPTSLDSGDSTAFNDRGEVVFLADFTDGSEGIFLSRPEPVTPPLVFGDNFETTDSTAWSSVVGMQP